MDVVDAVDIVVDVVDDGGWEEMVMASRGLGRKTARRLMTSMMRKVRFLHHRHPQVVVPAAPGTAAEEEEEGEGHDVAAFVDVADVVAGYDDVLVFVVCGENDLVVVAVAAPSGLLVASAAVPGEPGPSRCSD